MTSVTSQRISPTVLKTPLKTPFAQRYGAMPLQPGKVGALGALVQACVAPPVLALKLGIPVGGILGLAALWGMPLGTLFAMPTYFFASVLGGLWAFTNKPLRRFFSAPFTYFDWRAMKHYVRTGQKVPLFMPQNAVKQYRAVTYHAPTAGAVTGGFLGFKLGTPWARRAASEGGQMARHAGTTLAGGALGYTTGHGIKAMLLQHLKSLKFLR
jgi:hypothetical protein